MYVLRYGAAGIAYLSLRLGFEEGEPSPVPSRLLPSIVRVIVRRASHTAEAAVVVSQVSVSLADVVGGPAASEPPDFQSCR